eukprot:68333_1
MHHSRHLHNQPSSKGPSHMSTPSITISKYITLFAHGIASAQLSDNPTISLTNNAMISPTNIPTSHPLISSTSASTYIYLKTTKSGITIDRIYISKELQSHTIQIQSIH